ncbi:MAG: iron-regulated protein [Bacteroidetes bacterium HGW-Bacteroidetes-19]|nr:MAG: iron-regulated protein [Bacteroidetes bacterium HGW-Bacteroidetes-19]
MKNKLLLLVIILFIGVQINGQTTKNEKPAYLIFDSKGELVDFSSLISDISNADICLFGELHNDPISHWLEIELIKEFNLAKNKQLIVGAEMWERDNQLLIDEAFVHKFYDEAMYLESSKLWSNTKPDYLPILQYCAKNNLKFIGTNIPRRYARMVSRSGIESLNSLSELAKTYIAPLPILIDLNEYSYKTMIEDMPQGNTMKMTNPENLAKAQAVKDATMAYFIQKETMPGYLFFHFHGEFHSAFYSGIFFYLKQYNPKLKVKSISIVKQENINVLDKENLNRADYIIVVPESMSVTY